MYIFLGYRTMTENYILNSGTQNQGKGGYCPVIMQEECTSEVKIKLFISMEEYQVIFKFHYCR